MSAIRRAGQAGDPRRSIRPPARPSGSTRSSAGWEVDRVYSVRPARGLAPRARIRQGCRSEHHRAHRTTASCARRCEGGKDKFRAECRVRLRRPRPGHRGVHRRGRRRVHLLHVHRAEPSSPAGTNAVVAFDLNTGKPKWRSPRRRRAHDDAGCAWRTGTSSCTWPRRGTSRAARGDDRSGRRRTEGHRCRTRSRPQDIESGLPGPRGRRTRTAGFIITSSRVSATRRREEQEQTMLAFGK